MTIRSIILFLLCHICCVGELLGQSDSTDYRGTVCVKAHIAVPMNDFAEVWDVNLFGLGGEFVMPLRHSILSLGSASTWDRTYKTSDDLPVNGTSGSDTLASLKAANLMFTLMGVARISPLRGRLRPYADVMAGGRLLFLNADIDVEAGASGFQGSSTDVRTGSAWGWAVGVMMKATTRFYIDLRYERSNGGLVTFADPSSIKVDRSGAVSIGSTAADTDVYRLQLGVAWEW